MKHEFWAEFDLYGSRNKRRIIEDLVGKRQSSSPWANITDAATRQAVLAQILATDEEYARRTKCKDYAKGKNGLQHWYYAGDLETPGGEYQSFLGRRLRWMGAVVSLANHNEDTVGPALSDLVSFLPPGSWAVQIHFTLHKPYLSKDDVGFYIIDNPVKKEWVFKVPYVAPSQWKGALRAAMMRELVEDLRSGQKNEAEFIQARLRLYRLFGNEKDGAEDFLNRALTLYRVGPRPEDEHQAQEWERKYKHTYAQVSREFEAKVRDAGYRNENVEGFRGRLHFYPTFFDRIGLEVINPHPRDTGAGKQPIYFESVPAGTQGVFTLLYVPLDRVGRSTPEAMEQEAKADLEAVARGVRAMLTAYGFGAKTSSGYGVVEDESATVVVKTNVPGWFKTAPPSETIEIVQPEEAFLKYLDETGEVKETFKGSGEGGLLSNLEYKQRGQSLGGGSLAEFKRFRSWYLTHGAAWRDSRSKQKPADSSALGGQQRTFYSLSQFVQIV